MAHRAGRVRIRRDHVDPRRRGALRSRPPQPTGPGTDPLVGEVPPLEQPAAKIDHRPGARSVPCGTDQAIGRSCPSPWAWDRHVQICAGCIPRSGVEPAGFSTRGSHPDHRGRHGWGGVGHRVGVGSPSPQFLIGAASVLLRSGGWARFTRRLTLSRGRPYARATVDRLRTPPRRPPSVRRSIRRGSPPIRRRWRRARSST